MRKHRHQMNANEIAALEAAVRQAAATAIYDHAILRMGQKQVSGNEMHAALRYGQAIEVHNDAGPLRVVVRHAYGRPKVAVCVVIQLEESGATIITTWKNRGSDNHGTLNLGAYRWNVDVCCLFSA